MADLIYDTFTDTNGTFLGAHVGETGATWTWESGWGSYDNSFEIRSNRLMLVATGSNRDELYYPSGLISGGNWSVEFGFIVDGTDYQYMKVWSGVDVYGGVDALIQVRSDPGTSEVVFSGYYGTYTPPASAFVLGQEYIVRVDAIGQDLSYYVDGVLIGTHTAADPQTPFLSINMGIGLASTPSLGMTYLQVSSAAPAGPFWTAYVKTAET